MTLAIEKWFQTCVDFTVAISRDSQPLALKILWAYHSPQPRPLWPIVKDDGNYSLKTLEEYQVDLVHTERQIGIRSCQG